MHPCCFAITSRCPPSRHYAVRDTYWTGSVEAGVSPSSSPADCATHTDFAKALALGADGVALANSAMQAIGCVAARICNTNRCPAGIATQNPELRARLDPARAAERLATFLSASVELMQVMARACGHDHLDQFKPDDLASWKKETADLAGIEWSGFHTQR
ncbi:glutamate synthase-related protein [Rhodococcus oryzae]|uniref:glutamate synthase-related protein n=1 Tax=Rhodococcus oryzae TaxID=2571143 RepID=UPI0037137C85